MALTNMVLTNQSNMYGGFMETVEFNGDASYLAGGAAFEALFKALVGHDRKIQAAFGYGANNSVEFIPATGKLKMRAANGSEVPDTTNLAAVVFRVTVLST